MKKCQYCGEDILSVAIKCKHCGEFFNKPEDTHQNEEKDDEPEKIIWEGKPSHWYYLVAYIFGVLVFLGSTAGGNVTFGLFVGLLIIIPGFLTRHFTKYTLTSKGVKSEKGIISRSIYEVAVKDIRSVNVQQSLIERLFGLGTINIGTAGTAGIEVSFRGIPSAVEIKNQIKGTS